MKESVKALDIGTIAETLLSAEDEGKRNIPRHSTPRPSVSALEEMMEILRSAIYPGFFNRTARGSGSESSMRHQLTAQLDNVFRTLSEQIGLGVCFVCTSATGGCTYKDDDALDMASDFMKRLPHIRDLLDGDVLAAFEGDPAAQSKAETIFCYPSITAMTHHRIAHELYKLGTPVIPRIIGEMAHSRTGIDIHPGASIGEEFFIDHGTGVVIGETCIIGKRCRIYQGVTLGALSFPKDGNGILAKGLPRHPILEDNVIVYSGATILGRITIGAGSTIGGNVWLTHDVAPGSRIIQQRSKAAADGDKIQGEK